jgi:hypothetical protein
MSPRLGRVRGELGLRLHNPRARTRLIRWGATLIVACLVYLAWPYAALWDLSRAVAAADPQALAARIDVAAVRDEIRKKLNKDAPSTIGKLSDPFILWLERGIRRLGTGALDELVTLDWVRERLSADAPAGQGLLRQVSYAFFDSPAGFRVRLGAPGQAQVHFRMALEGLQWRVTAVYY